MHLLIPEKKCYALRISTIIASIIIYILLIIPLYKTIGFNTLIISLIPLITTSLLFGLKVGLFMTFIVSFILSPTLLSCLGLDYAYYYSLLGTTDIIGVIVQFVVVIIIGYMRDLYMKVKKLNQKITDLSRTDYLTNLLNRRAVFEIANKEFENVVRQKANTDWYLNQSETVINESDYEDAKKNREFKRTRELNDYLGVLSLAIIDIDDFKEINDSFGHPTGDIVLKKVGDILTENNLLRRSDICGRFGGEEFLVILPGTSSRNSLHPLNRLRRHFQEYEFKTDKGESFRITLSCGVSQNNPQDSGVEDILKRADEALYRAKKQGKNQVAIYESKFQI